MRAGTRDCDLGTGNGSEIGVETYQTAANIHHRDTGPTLQQGQKLASVNRPTAALPDCLTRRNSLPAQTPKRSPFSLPLRIHNHRRRFIVVSVVGTFSLQSFVPLSPPHPHFREIMARVLLLFRGGSCLLETLPLIQNPWIIRVRLRSSLTSAHKP